MTHQTQDNQDSSFPYVLVYSTISTSSPSLRFGFPPPCHSGQR
jgi:hypothetical protein